MRGLGKIKKGLVIAIFTMTFLVLESKLSTSEHIYNPMKEMGIV
jgi:hypothetical protein